tara:strand:+ start:193 stop:480 length:288 start_codon:yes stop_codon:yes gene_type:complete
MIETKVVNISANELAVLISEEIQKTLEEHSILISSKLNESNKPHLTRTECAEFFDVTIACINAWSNQGILTKMKVGNRVYYSREACLKVMFNKID